MVKLHSMSVFVHNLLEPQYFDYFLAKQPYAKAQVKELTIVNWSVRLCKTM